MAEVQSMLHHQTPSCQISFSPTYEDIKPHSHHNQSQGSLAHCLVTAFGRSKWKKFTQTQAIQNLKHKTQPISSAILHTCWPIQFMSIKYSFFIILGRYGHIGKWVQENIIFMRFCCCFKLTKKIKKLLNEQLTHTIPNAQTGTVQ